MYITYRVSHFNRQIQIAPKIRQIQKNGQGKNCRRQRGTFNRADSFDLQVNFQGHLKVKVIKKKLELLFLTPDLKRAENFTLKMIFEFFSESKKRSNQELGRY